MNLRGYQEDAIARIRGAFRHHNRVLFQLPTGGGKTVIASYMTDRARQKARVFFVVHRKELIDQTVRTFEEVGIPTSVIAAGWSANYTAPVQVCSIDTLKNRLDRVPQPGLVIWDECHHVAAGGWARVASHFTGAKHVGLTATPERLDGKGLRDHFDTMVLGPTVTELIEAGHLADYRLFMPAAPDLSGVGKSMGDFKKDQAAAIMDTGKIYGDVIRNYRKNADGKPAVAFCVSIKHSIQTVERFKEAGYVAVHVDGTMDRRYREGAIKAFRSGQIQILSNVDLFGEGFDVPGIEAAILLRPTQSLSLYLQQIGRALRPADGKKHAVILDHAGNVTRHGLPDESRAWSLDGKKGRKKNESNGEDPVRTCPKCFCHHRPRPSCPSCGHVYEIAGRVVEEVEGDLQEMDPKEIQRRRRNEQYKTRDLEDLIALGESRGYKNPEKWAAHIYTAREARRRERERAYA